MDLSGQFSNPLSGQFSNPFGPLKTLLGVASAVPEAHRKPPTHSRSRPLGRRLGAIKRAVLSVLSDADGAIRARDAHASGGMRFCARTGASLRTRSRGE